MCFKSFASRSDFHFLSFFNQTVIYVARASVQVQFKTAIWGGLFRQDLIVNFLSFFRQTIIYNARAGGQVQLETGLRGSILCLKCVLEVLYLIVKF